MGKFETDKISRDELISLMIGREVAEESTAKTGGNSENLLQVHDLTLTHKNRTILSGINFSLQKGEVLGIAGLLGAGRTELLKFLYGEFPADHSGTISFMGESFIPDNPGKAIGKGIIYLSEDRQREGIFQHHQLIFNSSISALAQFSTVGYIHTSTEKEAVNEKFGELNVRKSSMQQKISTLSGGNQQKVLLSRILLLNPRLLLLDEPTRGIDVGAKQDIYQLIEELSGKGISMIVTSSEIPELMWICHRILVLSQGRQTAILESSKTNSREILHFAFQQV
jgi:ABC-type sugar transport system ATPase subunit